MNDVLDRLYRRLIMTVGRGRLNLTDDTGNAQAAQIDHGPLSANGSLDIRDNTPVLLAFGLASNPPAGADAISLSLGGDRNKAVIIAHGHQQYRLKNLAPGDAALHDMRGAYLWFTAAGPVLDAAGGNVTIQNATNINVTGTGTVTVTAPHVIVSSNDVELGGSGGAAVARVGDTVSGGVITSGSSKVKAS